MSDPKPTENALFLKDAYALKTTEDSQKLYDAWAETYDEEFAKAHDYNTPDLIAELYAERTRDTSARVLDIGAGTGLVAEGLKKRGIVNIDALDISIPMLDIAKSKDCYQNLIVADLNKNLDIPDNTYGGITSTGTFTHGHVGPDAINGLVRIAHPGALFILGIKDIIYESAGFAAKFAELSTQICDFEIVKKAGYGANATADLQASYTWVAVFRKV